MRKFILMFGNNKKPLHVGGRINGSILFTKEEAEARLNEDSHLSIEVLEISSRPVEIVTNKVSIV